MAGVEHDITVAAWLDQAAGRLASRLEAQVLLGHVLGRDRAWFYAHGESFLEPAVRETADALLRRRLEGEPVAQITGRREFWSRDFLITPDVLIPRPETELLVEQALATDQPDGARVLDLGTGSGCIAVTLACERPRWQVTATDRCPAALAAARDNARRLEAENLEFLEGRWFEPLTGRRFDLVVSNPPYIAAEDPHLDRGDLRFEPRPALVAEDNGLADLDWIISGARSHLEPGGWLMLELGHDQAAAVRERMTRSGFGQVELVCDGAGIQRVARGRLG